MARSPESWNQKIVLEKNSHAKIYCLKRHTLRKIASIFVHQQLNIGLLALQSTNYSKET